MKIAILYDIEEKLHTTNWSLSWEKYCNDKSIDFEVVNPYEIGVVLKLMSFDIILWHYSNYSFKDMLMARNVLLTLEDRGKTVFPSFKDAWHFDDKLAETYLLESVNAPIPKSFYYYEHKDVQNAISENMISFPIVAKLRNGSGSHNVKLIRSSQDLLNYAKTILNEGINSAPSLLYKTSSNIKSSKNIKTFVKRAKRIPEFLRSLSNAKKFNLERGYVFLQEFIKNDNYDLKVIVVGDKLTYIGRNIREGEFRASGGGSLFYDRDKVSQNVIDSAFETSDKLGFNCMGYDYVISNTDNKGYIIEISYGFSHHAALEAEGYFDRKGIWHEEPLNVPEEILSNLIFKMQ